MRIFVAGGLSEEVEGDGGKSAGQGEALQNDGAAQGKGTRQQVTHRREEAAHRNPWWRREGEAEAEVLHSSAIATRGGGATGDAAWHMVFSPRLYAMEIQEGGEVGKFFATLCLRD